MQPFPLPSDLTHAGGIVLRTEGESTRVLLVRASLAPSDWVLPKGHVESGEAPEETARREVREEAGVDGLPTLYLGSLEFYSFSGEHVRAGYFLMRFVAEVPSLEAREVLWCSASEALRLVRFDNMKALIRSAERAFGI